VSSSELFGLAERFGVWPRPRDPLSETQRFGDFWDAYTVAARARDERVKAHLRGQKNWFRSYLDWSLAYPRAAEIRKLSVWDTLQQLVWYMDEVVLEDPVSIVSSRGLGLLDLRASRYTVIPDPVPEMVLATAALLDCLAPMRAAIEGGRLLLLVKALSTEEDYAARKFLWELESATGLTSEWWWGLQESDPQRLWPTPDELASWAMSKAVMQRFEAAGSRAVALYDSPIRAAIAGAIDDKRATLRQADVSESFELTLPFVQGVPPERLLDLRAELPEAFKAFRATMATYVWEGLKEIDFDIPTARERGRRLVELHVLPEATELEAGFKAAMRRAKLVGFGSTIVGGVGALIAHVSGIASAADIAMILTAGGVGALVGAGDLVRDASGGRRDAAYFLWRATGSA